jgi:hypothetical protein
VILPDHLIKRLGPQTISQGAMALGFRHGQTGTLEQIRHGLS